ncbi:MAG TPA: metallophosphoesterase [Myxococcota bacterium]|nr:metallophosphoesterase [Myxococcota bacterium]
MSRRLAALLLALALSGCGRVAPLRIVVIGDYGRDGPTEAAVAALVHGLRPDLVATVGDNNYPDGGADTIDRNIGKYYADYIAPYRGSFGKGAQINRFFPSLGNHDWRTAGAQPYLDYFALPGNERYYEIPRGDVRLFFLDSDPHEPDGIARDSAQARWLHDALGRATERHRWVLFHHPPYSSGPHGSNAELQWPFRAWGATAVICGHDHLYERLEREGMTFVTVGAGGASLYQFAEPVEGSVVRVGGQHGALRIDVSGDRADAEFATTGDAIADEFALPPASAFAAPVSLLEPGSSWRVLDGVAPRDGWQRADFDTGDWAPAEVPLRVFDRGAAAGAPERTTSYRTRFEIPAGREADPAELGLPRDQAAVAYLNGREVARVEPARVKNWLVPRGPRGGAATAPILVHHPLPAGALVAGTNVLAVQVRRVPDQDGDPSFDAELWAYPRSKL